MKKTIAILLGFFVFSLNALGAIYPGPATTSFSARGYVNNYNEPMFLYLAAMGLVGDSTTDWVFGENPDVDSSEDVWDGGATYTYSADATADIQSIACAAGNTHVITITGLDVSGNYVSQTATCNGTTRVALTTDLWRVNTVSNDSATDSSGDVVVYTGTGAKPTIGTSTIRSYLHEANNKALSSIRTIPNDTVGIIYRFFGKVTRYGTASSEADLVIKTRKYGKQFQPYDRGNLASLTGPPYENKLLIPLILPGKTDVMCTVDSSGDDMGIGCGYELMIYDEDLFTTDFLTGIGQP